MCADSTTCFCDETDSDVVGYCPECGDELTDGNERRGPGCLNCQRCPECLETLAACEGFGGSDCGHWHRVYGEVAKAMGYR